MAPWDSKIRWRFGGNLQPVRMICEFNWRECPFAIIKYIWSEIVTDVVECATNEGLLLRVIILLLVCTILMHTIWTRAQWITENLTNKDNLNRVGFKVQDLELRVNILTYKMQYGTWPSPKQIRGTDVKGHRSNIRLTLSSSGDGSVWLTKCLAPDWRPRNSSRSEHLGLRYRKQKTLIETSKKIYYNRPNTIQRIPEFRNPRRYEFHRLEERKRALPMKIENGPIKKLDFLKDKAEESMQEHKIENIGNFVKKDETSKTAEEQVPPCENSYDSRNQTKSSFDSPACLNRIKSSQVMLSEVKHQLEGLQTVIKTYDSQQNVKLSEKEIVKQELAKAFLQELNDIQTETESDEKSTEVSNPIESNTEDDPNARDELISSDGNVSDRNNSGCDKNEKSDIIEQKGKGKLSSDTEDDLVLSSSSRIETSKGSGSDKSSTSDALMLSAILNKLGSSRWNKSDDDSDGEPETTFSKMKSFNSLDIISEEQSGSSCNERGSKINVNASRTSSLRINEIVSRLIPEEPERSNNNDAIKPSSCKIETNVEDIEKIFEPLDPPQNYTDLLGSLQPEMSVEKLPDQTIETLNGDAISPWKNLIDVSSEETIENISPRLQSTFWELDIKNEVSISNESEPENLKVVNKESIADTNLTLSRRPGCFSMTSAPPTAPEDKLSINAEDDLIDLDDTTALRATKEDTKCQRHNCTVQSLMDINAEVLSAELESDRPFTGRTVICSSPMENNLIELEKMTYEELTNIENNWDSHWPKCTSHEEDKPDSPNKKTPVSIFSRASSLYLTGQGSFSDISIYGGNGIESISNAEIPEEIKPLEKIETHGTGSTAIIKNRALCNIQLNLATDTKNKPLFKRETSSLNSSDEASSYADADSNNFLESGGVDLSFDKTDLNSLSHSVPVPIMKNLKNIPPIKPKQLPKKPTINPKKLKEQSNVPMKKEATKNIKNIQSNLKQSQKAKSTLNLIRNNSMDSKKNTPSGLDLTQRRSRSYVTPRKYEASPRTILSSQSFTKKQDSRIKDFEKKFNFDNKTNSKIKNVSKSSLSSRESMQKSSSKSCIPVLQNRLEGVKKDDLRRKSPQRGPLTISAGIKNISYENHSSKDTLCSPKDHNGDNTRENWNNATKNSTTNPESEIIYLNIVGNPNENMKDSQPFLEYVKDRDLHIQRAVEVSCNFLNENIDCTPTNPETPLFQRREIEVLVKPSVTHTSTSISDLP